jgi:hypothetical protein
MDQDETNSVGGVSPDLWLMVQFLRWLRQWKGSGFTLHAGIHLCFVASFPFAGPVD